MFYTSGITEYLPGRTENWTTIVRNGFELLRAISLVGSYAVTFSFLFTMRLLPMLMTIKPMLAR